jgi:hypothetical protein
MTTEDHSLPRSIRTLTVIAVAASQATLLLLWWVQSTGAVCFAVGGYGLPPDGICAVEEPLTATLTIIVGSLTVLLVVALAFMGGRVRSVLTIVCVIGMLGVAAYLGLTSLLHAIGPQLD